MVIDSGSRSHGRPRTSASNCALVSDKDTGDVVVAGTHAKRPALIALSTRSQPQSQKVRVDATCQRDGRYRDARLHAGRHGLGLELVAVLPPVSTAVIQVLRDGVHVAIKRWLMDARLLQEHQHFKMGALDAHDQAPVRPCKSALSRAEEEHRTTRHAVRVVQPVDGALEIAGCAEINARDRLSNSLLECKNRSQCAPDRECYC